MDLEEYKSIKIPKWVYDNWQECQLRLSRKGLGSLPEDILSPSVCPICQEDLEIRESKKKVYLVCSHCGYAQQQLGKAAAESGLGGIAMGLGLGLLLNALMSK